MPEKKESKGKVAPRNKSKVASKKETVATKFKGKVTKSDLLKVAPALQRLYEYDKIHKK